MRACLARLQALGRAQNNVVCGRQAGDLASEGHLAAVVGAEGQFVPPVEQLKQCLQIVVAIRPPAGDMQEQVQLCRRREGKGIAHWLAPRCH